MSEVEMLKSRQALEVRRSNSRLLYQKVIKSNLQSSNCREYFANFPIRCWFGEM